METKPRDSDYRRMIVTDKAVATPAAVEAHARAKVVSLGDSAEEVRIIHQKRNAQHTAFTDFWVLVRLRRRDA